MNRAKPLSGIIDIHQGEGRITALLFVLSFLLGISFNFLETAAFPLFMVEFGAQSLPYIYIINAFVVAGITSVYLRLGGRIKFSNLLALNLTFLLAALVVFRVGLGLQASSWVVFLLPVLFQIAVSLGNIAYWTLAGRLFNLRQAKRLFGLLSAGMWVAIVITGFAIPAIVRLIGTANLLVLSAAGMTLALGLLIYILRTAPATLEQQHAAESEQERRSILDLLKNRYVLLMFSLSVVAWIAFFFVDNIFYNRVGAQFPSEDQMSGFLGIYLAILGILTLLITTFVSAPVIGRFGVRTGLMVLPVSLLVGVLLFAGTGTVLGIVPILFIFATLNKLLDLSLGFSIDQSAQTILYQPLPARERSDVQTIDEGMVRMVAIGIAGVLLLVLNTMLGASVVLLSYVLLVIVVVWVGAVILTGRAYPRALLDALVQRRLSGSTLQLSDDASIAVLERAAQSPQPGAALYALDALTNAVPTRSANIWRTALAHPAAAVRIEALRRVSSSGDAAALPEVRDMLADEQSPQVKAAILRTLAALGELDLVAIARPFLSDQEPEIRLGALAALVAADNVSAHNIANTEIDQLRHSANVADRVLAAEALAETHDADMQSGLDSLIEDEYLDVRRAAIEAAGRIKLVWFWPFVAAAITEPALRNAAARALIAGGDEALSAIARALDASDIAREDFIRLTRVCGRIGSDASARLLLVHIGHSDAAMRDQVLAALNRTSYQAVGPERVAVEQQIRLETGYAARLLAAQLDVQAAAESSQPSLAFLARTLAGQFTRTRERVLALLALLVDRQTIQLVRDSLAHSSPEQRSYAVEVLDIQLPTALKPLVLPLVEEHSPENRLQRLQAIFPQERQPLVTRLQEMAAAVDERSYRWSRVCALYVLGELHMSGGDSVAPLVAALRSADPLLQETAARALSRLDDETIDACRLLLGEAISADSSELLGQFHVSQPSGEPMLSTIEKLIILKDAQLFADTPDEILADVAQLADEIRVEAGEPVFAKGDKGDCMFVVAAGEVHVHDQGRTLNRLGPGQVFGEMALLDPEPRMASVTAVDDTQLLRLDQEPFFELLEDRIEVTRGIIRVSTARLRERG